MSQTRPLYLLTHIIFVSNILFLANCNVAFAVSNTEHHEIDNQLILAAAPDQKNQTTNKSKSETLDLLIYSYLEADSENEDGNRSGSDSISSFSETAAKHVRQSLASLYPDKLKFKQQTGSLIKRVHYEMDKPNMPYNYCNAHDADYLISIFSQDNSPNDPYSRNISFTTVDCKSKRAYRKTMSISNSDPSNSFDYEQDIQKRFNTFINGIPPYISLSKIDSTRVVFKAPKNRVVFYSYAQPGHHDKQNRITGSYTSHAYSKNSVNLLHTHVKNRFKGSLDIQLYSGDAFKPIYYQMDDPNLLRQLCRKDNASMIVSSYSENSAGRFIHFRHVTYTVANCENNRIYKKKYRLDRDEKNDGFGFELDLHSTFQNFLLTLPPYIATANN